MDSIILLNFLILAMGLFVGVVLGKALARDDAVISGEFVFQGQLYKVVEGE